MSGLGSELEGRVDGTGVPGSGCEASSGLRGFVVSGLVLGSFGFRDKVPAGGEVVKALQG